MATLKAWTGTGWAPVSAAAFPVRRRTTVVRVPSDAPTLQAAFDSINPAFVERGATVEIRIDAGHRPASGVRLADADYSMVRITSVDPVVTVSTSFTGDFIRVDRGGAPTLACLVDMIDRGGEGYMLVGSVGHVEAGCGIRNAGARGLYVGNTSTCDADGAIFTGSNNRNVWVTRGSTLNAENGDFSANKGGENAVYVSRRSRANIEDANVTSAFLNGVVSTRSDVNATRVNVSGAGGIGLLAERGGTLQAQDATVADCGSHGAVAYNASILLVKGATVTNSGDAGVRAFAGGRIDCTEATVTGSRLRDLLVERGSIISAWGTTTTTGTGTPAVADVNVSALNAISSNGIIFA